MHLMIAVCTLVVTGAGCSASVNICNLGGCQTMFRSECIWNIFSLIIFLLLTIGPFVLLVWLLWPARYCEIVTVDRLSVSASAALVRLAGNVTGSFRSRMTATAGSPPEVRSAPMTAGLQH